MSKLIVTLSPVFCGQVAMALLFYRSRAVSHAIWTESDLVVFGSPLAVGFAAFAGVLFLSFSQTSPQKSMVAILGPAAACAVAAFFVSMLIALNLYGA